MYRLLLCFSIIVPIVAGSCLMLWGSIELLGFKEWIATQWIVTGPVEQFVFLCTQWVVIAMALCSSILAVALSCSAIFQVTISSKRLVDVEIEWSQNNKTE